jgi:predicted dehydrogenase
MAGRKLGIGVIGCGGIARQKHLPALTECGDLCEITAFYDTDAARAEAARAQYGAKGSAVYTDAVSLLAAGSVDVVYVLTPTESHAEYCIKAFENGKHVLCEKPLADTAADAQKIMDAWVGGKTAFTVGCQNRFRVEAQALHAMCRAGELGEIYYARVRAVRRCAVPVWSAGGATGPLLDIGFHALDMALWLIGCHEPLRVTGSMYHKLGAMPHAGEANAFGPWHTGQIQAEDSAFAQICLKNGATIQLETAWALNAQESRELAVELCGTKAGAEISFGLMPGESALRLSGNAHGLLWSAIAAPEENRLKAAREPSVGHKEARQWLMAVREKTQPLVLPQEAFGVTRILSMARESAQRQREVYADDKE